MAAALSVGDWIAFTGVGLAGIAYIGREVRAWRSDGREQATTDATLSTQVASFEKALSQIAETLSTLSRRQNDHEASDARFQGAMEAVMKSNQETILQLARTMERISAQIAHLGPQSDSFSEVLPPTGRRSR